jgi:hypothetical protein
MTECWSLLILIHDSQLKISLNIFDGLQVMYGTGKMTKVAEMAGAYRGVAYQQP